MMAQPQPFPYATEQPLVPGSALSPAVQPLAEVAPAAQQPVVAAHSAVGHSAVQQPQPPASQQQQPAAPVEGMQPPPPVAAAAAKQPADPTRLAQNLSNRFPWASKEQVEAALKAHNGHAGRAAKELGTIPERQRLTEEKIRMAFRLFDMDGSGAISYREFKAAVESLGFIMSDDLDDDEIRSWYAECDTNGDGLIQVEEFAAFMRSQWGTSGRAGQFAGKALEDVPMTKNSRYQLQQARQAETKVPKDPWAEAAAKRDRNRARRLFEAAETVNARGPGGPKKGDGPVHPARTKSRACVVQ